MVPAYHLRINYYQAMSAEPSTRSNGVPPYAVKCVQADPAAMADGHLHVTSIETSDPDGGTTRWSLVQVIEAVRDGERFILREGDDGQAAELGPTVCPRCSVATLAPDPSASWLRLPICPEPGAAKPTLDAAPN